MGNSTSSFSGLFYEVEGYRGARLNTPYSPRLWCLDRGGKQEPWSREDAAVPAVNLPVLVSI